MSVHSLLLHCCLAVKGLQLQLDQAANKLQQQDARLQDPPLLLEC